MQEMLLDDIGPAAPGYSMPWELHDQDGNLAYVRADGMSRGQARRAFASEWGEPFVRIRVSTAYFGPPRPYCDECGKDASCGVEVKWPRMNPYKSPVCESCQQLLCSGERADDGFGSRVPEWAKPVSLEAVEPYDGWPVEHAGSRAPKAVRYWRGELA